MTPQYLKNRITCKAKLKVEVILAIVLVTFLFIGCKKDLGSGGGDPGSDDSSQLKLAAGSLKDLSGACMPIIANGKYVYNTVLDDSNYIVVPVNFISAGKYSISTDTSNGFSFQTSGITTATGVQNIILKATGKPIGAYLTTFSIAFDTSICTFSVDVSDSVITPAITSNDYFPMTENSNWTYRHSGAIDGESLATVSAADTIIGGNDFKTFIYSQPDYNGGYSVSGKGYYRKADGLYYEYGYINDLTINLVADRTEFIFLKDNVPVNTTWESPEVDATLYPDTSIYGKLKAKFTIIGKDVEIFSSQPKVLDSVISVKREFIFTSSSPGASFYPQTCTFSYAKNIGFINGSGDPVIIPALGEYLMRWEIY